MSCSDQRAVFLLHKNAGSLFLPLVKKGKLNIMTVVTNKEKHSGGRPVKAIKREAATGVRFTKAEYFIVKEKARKAGYKITQYIRVMALEGQVIARLNQHEKELIPQLIGMANNLNQLTKKAHQESILSAVLFFEKYRGEIDQILNRLRYDQ